MRSATIERKTRETDIKISLDLDGTGTYDIETGIGFLNHMLESFAKHAAIDLKVRAKGDLHIDFHHTTEDTGIAIGLGIAKALGDRAGMGSKARALELKLRAEPSASSTGNSPASARRRRKS